MGRFPDAEARYRYRSLNCLYCARYRECDVVERHKQVNGDQQAQVDLDRIIPWDGEQNGRCAQFKEARS
jgi:hypothetical protein